MWDLTKSWDRAMKMAYERAALSVTKKKRYRVYGYYLGDGRWAYAVDRAMKWPQEPLVLTAEEAYNITQNLPRCAQRARLRHGGNSKVAIPNRRLAEALGKVYKQGVFHCKLPPGIIGNHWHLTSGDI